MTSEREKLYGAMIKQLAYGAMQGPGSKSPCYICKQQGHYADQCLDNPLNIILRLEAMVAEWMELRDAVLDMTITTRE
jgi:hypothetical protein